MPFRKYPKIEDRIYFNINNRNPNECWLWTASLHSNGYGQAMIGKHRTGAHRLSWIIHNGPIKKGLQVCHRCDIRRCVNPSHLFLGSFTQNMKDMVEKGRSGKGEKNSQAKITAEEVIKIREMAKNNTHSKIASIFSLSRQSIGEIINRVTWNHV